MIVWSRAASPAQLFICVFCVFCGSILLVCTGTNFPFVAATSRSD
jgi:hypothetical protein